MTDNRTNELTPEQILVDEWIRQADRAKSMTGMDAIWFPDAEETLAALRANGLLSEGAPSEKQARAIRKLDNVQAILAGAQASVTDAVRELSLTSAALTAAQGAARPVNGFDTTAERVKNGADSVHVAPQEPSGVTNANGHSWMAWNESGKNGTYCRSCGGWAGKVGNRQCSPAQVLPSSGVDEDALRPFLKNLIFQYNQERVTLKTATRYLAEWLKGQER